MIQNSQSEPKEILTLDAASVQDLARLKDHCQTLRVHLQRAASKCSSETLAGMLLEFGQRLRICADIINYLFVQGGHNNKEKTDFRASQLAIEKDPYRGIFAGRDDQIVAICREQVVKLINRYQRCLRLRGLTRSTQRVIEQQLALTRRFDRRLQALNIAFNE